MGAPDVLLKSKHKNSESEAECIIISIKPLAGRRENSQMVQRPRRSEEIITNAENGL